MSQEQNHSSEQKPTACDKPPSVPFQPVVQLLIRLYEDYVELLGEELNELAPFSAVHGWKSKRAEKGKEYRAAIAELKSQLNNLLSCLCYFRALCDIERNEMQEKAYIEIVEGGRMPAKAHATDAAYDCYAREVEVLDFGVVRCSLGFRLELPAGWFADMRPRSSIWKTGLWLSNSCGIVDAGYRGEVMAYFYGIQTVGASVFKPGDRVAQMMIRKLDEIEIMRVHCIEKNSERGEGGFGSTGK